MPQKHFLQILRGIEQDISWLLWCLYDHKQGFWLTLLRNYGICEPYDSRNSTNYTGI